MEYIAEKPSIIPILWYSACSEQFYSIMKGHDMKLSTCKNCNELSIDGEILHTAEGYLCAYCFLEKISNGLDSESIDILYMRTRELLCDD